MEISRHLNISEETVKRHIRNILHKFDSVNIRDAYEALSDHMYVFGPDGLHINYFCHSMKRDLYISEGRADAHFKEVLEIEAIYRPVTEFSVEMMHSKGSIKNKRINGQDLLSHPDKQLFDVWSAPVKPTLEPGEIGIISHSMNQIGHYSDAQNSLGTFVRQPIGTIGFRIHFQKNDLPKRVYGKKQSVVNSRFFEPCEITYSNGIAHLNAVLPTSKFVYGIWWEWN